MKFKFLKAVAAGLILSASCFVSVATAGLITYNGYTLDEDTNIVTGNALEWLQWDETVGQSVNEALGIYSVDGWRLASNNNMSALFNSFFPEISWDDDENTSQEPDVSLPWDSSEDSQYSHLIELFGKTSPNAVEYTQYPLDPFLESCGIFGLDADQDGYINVACAYDDYTWFDDLIDGPENESSWVSMLGDEEASQYTRDTHYSEGGIVLVRSVSVPEPSTLAIFALGMIGLASRRFKKQ